MFFFRLNIGLQHNHFLIEICFFAFNEQIYRFFHDTWNKYWRSKGTQVSYSFSFFT